MITGFNPAVSNNRNQRQNFKALPKGIDKTDRTAYDFLLSIKKGKLNLSEGDKVELVELEKNTKDPGIKDYFTEALEHFGIEPKK
ncbi:MAG: hypothetical protein PHE78_00235 [Candidatus Gastranaerophilales bacterium]|nr:hypothetical protein [Candidatus Gastranaerophilales bacterium]